MAHGQLVIGILLRGLLRIDVEIAFADQLFSIVEAHELGHLVVVKQKTAYEILYVNAARQMVDECADERAVRRDLAFGGGLSAPALVPDIDERGHAGRQTYDQEEKSHRAQAAIERAEVSVLLRRAFKISCFEQGGQ